MIALGIDLLEIDRIRRSLENPRFVRRVFGAQELEQLAARGFPAQSAAACFCAKEAFGKALGDKKGIMRYGQCLMPMDEALVMVALDFSGRAYLGYDVELRASRLNDEGEETRAKVGVFDTELVEEFFFAFVRNGKLTLHVKKISGKNTHHIIEAVFKAFGKAVRDAVGIDPEYAEEIPSTKGVL